ncbi:MAG: DNA translocase FtsK [Bacilli bacterium]|nr:DNA translocase FtsK [Bacilli bacterium]
MEKLKNIGIVLLILGIISLLFDEVVFKFCGIILISEAVIFLPVMNSLCKITNKYFSVGRKEALGIGTLFIPLFYAVANGYDTKSTIVIIIIYWFLMFLFNNNKYDKNILQDTIDDLSQKLDKLQGDLDIIQKDVESYGVIEKPIIREKIVVKKSGDNNTYYKPPINLLDNNENTINLRSALNTIKSNRELNSNNLLICLGKDNDNNNVYLDIKKSQNILITGSVGYGKSTLLNNIILTILMRNKVDDVKLLICETKTLDLSCYNGIANLMTPIINDVSKTLLNVQKLNILIDERIEILRQSKCKNIDQYNDFVKKKKDSGYKHLPYVVCVIDDLCDLMKYRKNDIEDAVSHLSRLGASVGVYLIVVTRNVSKEIITDNIKRSLQTIISFDLTSSSDSKIILNKTDAAKIDRIGEFIYKPIGTGKLIKVKGIYVSDKEINKVTKFIKEKNNYLRYDDNIVFLNSNEKDALFDEILDYAIENGEISAIIIQRNFNIGYNRAARIIDIFEDQGIVGPEVGNKPREVLIKYEE